MDQRVRSYPALSDPARINGNPSASNDPCKSSPENTGLMEDPML
jgi:hypothetical protein